MLDCITVYGDYFAQGGYQCLLLCICTILLDPTTGYCGMHAVRSDLLWSRPKRIRVIWLSCRASVQFRKDYFVYIRQTGSFDAKPGNTRPRSAQYW